MAGWLKTILKSANPSPSTNGPANPQEKREGTYWPQFFEADDLEAAKGIAITPEEGMSTDERWRSETAFMMEHIASRLAIGPKNVLIDFGCGVGRMSRALIERYDCTVVGVDQSAKMREHAQSYVGSSRFKAASPAEFDTMVKEGFVADFGMAIWVLQHCVHPAGEISRIANALAAEAPFLLVNSVHRLIPTHLGWGQDGENLDARMAERFGQLERMQFPESTSVKALRENSVISWWQRRV
ncbi:MAG TPA: class I SAM-dependent methyltransferase [Burkholderiales bacterium]